MFRTISWNILVEQWLISNLIQAVDGLLKLWLLKNMFSLVSNLQDSGIFVTQVSSTWNFNLKCSYRTITKFLAGTNNWIIYKLNQAGDKL